MSRNTRFFLVILAIMGMATSSLACSDTNLDDAEDFLDNSAASEAVNDAVDSAVGAAEDYVEEMASDALGMTEILVDPPQVSPEASQAARDGVIDALDTVGQAVLTVDAKAQALQECTAMCNFAFEDDDGHKTENNLLCIAQCRSK